MDYGTAMKSQWKTDIMEVTNDDLQRAYRATGAVTECGLRVQLCTAETNGWNQLDHSQIWIATGYGWMTGGGSGDG